MAQPRIYAYALTTLDGIMLLPKGGTILSVGTSRGTPTLWVAAPAPTPTEPRHVVQVAVGQPLPYPLDQLTLLGTIQLSKGDTVVHVFEVGAPSAAEHSV